MNKNQETTLTIVSRHKVRYGFDPSMDTFKASVYGAVLFVLLHALQVGTS